MITTFTFYTFFISGTLKFYAFIYKKKASASGGRPPDSLPGLDATYTSMTDFRCQRDFGPQSL